MAPGLYDLTILQREAKPEIWFFCKRDPEYYAAPLRKSQSTHHIPRTDSRYIGKDIVPTIKERLRPAESVRTESLLAHL